MKTKNEEMDSERARQQPAPAALKRRSNQIEPYVQEQWQPWSLPRISIFKLESLSLFKTFLHVFRLAFFVIYLQQLQSSIV
jgi:hypothetical protein